MAIVTVEKPLRDKLGDEGSEALIHLLNQSQQEQKEDVLEFVEEKFERRLAVETGKLRVEISNVKNELGEEIHRLDNRITEEIGRLGKRITDTEGRLLAKISETKTDMIKWMFIFWVGQVGMIIGILFAFFK